jgi:hypothetical protein
VPTFGDFKLVNFKTPSLAGSVSVLQQIPVHVLLIARVLFLLALAQRQHHFFQFVLVFKEMLLVLVIDDRTERLRVPPMTQTLLVFIQRKRSERPCPNDLASLVSKFGQLKPAKPRSGPGPHALAAWVSKFPRSRR